MLEMQFQYSFFLLLLVFDPLTLAQLPAPITFSPSGQWDGNDGPWSSFSLRLGSMDQSQHIRVLPAFSVSALFTIDKSGCPTEAEAPTFMSPEQCLEARGGVFDADQSSDWTYYGIFGVDGGSSGLGYLDVTVEFGSETVGLTSDNTQPLLSGQITAMVAVFDYWIGVFGLSPNPSRLANMSTSYPTFFNGLKKTGRIAGNSWSYTAGAYHRNFSANLIFAGYDSSRFNSKNSVQISMMPNTTFVVQIKKIEVTGLTMANQVISNVSFLSTIESALPYLYVEKSICSEFQRVFNLSYDSGSDLYFIPDDLHSRLVALNPSIIFTVCGSYNGGKTHCGDFPFPYAAFALNASYPLLKYPNGSIINSTAQSRRYFAIKQSNDANSVVLGRVFLQETHIFADFDRKFFNLSQTVFDSTAESRVSIVQAPSNATDDGAAALTAADVTGIVISVVAALATSCYLAFAKLKGRWPFKPPQPVAEEPGKPELDGTGRPCVELSTVDRKEMPCPDKPNEMAFAGQDVELEGSIPLYELPATVDGDSFHRPVPSRKPLPSPQT
ncbi:aspartic peptidase domain-containing protein [Phyllosticta capitalensis]